MNKRFEGYHGKFWENLNFMEYHNLINISLTSGNRLTLLGLNIVLAEWR